MSIELKTKIIDTVKVWGVNSPALLVTFTEGLDLASKFIGFLAVSVGLGYTIWKWRRDIKKTSNV